MSQEAALGFPDIYALHLLAAVTAHQGIARIKRDQNQWSEAEKHALDAIDIMAKRAHSPHLRVVSQIESYRLLHDICSKQGKVGRALMAKLNADLLLDHVDSEGGVDDFYIEKVLFYGDAAQRQFASTQQFISGVNQQRLQEHNAQLMAAVSAVTAANAALQPNSALAQSQLQMVNVAASMVARVEAKSISSKGTPWALPTFTQQLVDPKQGLNTPDIVKGFASSAAQAGGTSYQAGAQQVTQAVDSLTPYRQTGKVDGAAGQVEKFAEVFNAFLVQVQDIRK
jgi:hypothetical protein